MSDDFDAVFERTVVLAVDVFQTVLMCGFNNPFGIGITLDVFDNRQRGCKKHKKEVYLRRVMKKNG